MVASLETSETVTATAAAVEKPRRGRLMAGVAAVAGVVGWQAPRVVNELTKPPYLGAPAAEIAADLDCDNYAQSTNHDESVYRYHDQGTCSLEGTVITITTFNRADDERAFESVMKALIPVVHPTWEGATYAAGEGWNVADARNLTPETATLVVQRLGTGATKVIPFSGK
ncbi:hypothetical protein ACFPIJ_06500 [Dactylosporangium cerinum]|uniref:Uncharacterized protein n=1 Tax=Dactylosporangium cerinum TaxID=1434730 RepID=A0ABV9VPV5_9ACTN